MANKISFSEKFKKANSLSARDYVLNSSHQGINEFASCLLALLCVFPIFLNMFYNIYDGIAIPSKKVLSSQVLAFNDIWYYIILVLAFFMVFLSIYQVISLHFRTNLKECFHSSWLKDRWLPFCLILLLFWSFLSTCFSDNITYCFFGDNYRKDGFLTFCVFGLVFLTSFLPSEKNIKLICELLVFAGVSTGFMVTLGKNNASLFFFQTQSLRNSIFANSNHYGYYLSICFPLLIGLTINDKSKNVLLSLFRVAEFWLLTNAILYSNCRGGFIAIIVALCGWNIYVFWLNRTNWYKIVFMDLLFVFSTFFLNTGTSMVKNIYNIIPQIQDAANGGELTQVGSNRLVLWRMGFEESFEKPIFGHGPDRLLFILPYEITDKPHNEVVEITATLGYPAVIFYLAGIIGQAILFFKNIKKVSILEVIVFSSACCYFVSSLFGNVMFYTAPYYYMMLGFSYILLRRTKDAKPLFSEKKKKKKEETVENETILD